MNCRATVIWLKTSDDVVAVVLVRDEDGGSGFRLGRYLGDYIWQMRRERP